MRETLTYSAPLKDIGNLLVNSLDLSQGDHLCQFYQNDEMLMESLCHFAVPGLLQGDAVVIIATETHRSHFKRMLTGQALEASGHIASGQLTLLDAETALMHFMVNGMPDRELFQNTFSPLFKNLQSQFSSIRVFGEMVNILFQQQNFNATRRLEVFWNEFARIHPFSLMCGYGLNGTGGHSKMCLKVEEICASHTHLISNYGTLFTRRH